MKHLLLLIKLLLSSGFVLLAGSILLAPGAYASPDFDTYLDIEGNRLYRDHKKANVYYFSPSMSVIGTRVDNLPDVSLEIYRYMGRKGTGDSGDFWVKGILSIGITRSVKKKRNKKIKNILRKSYKVRTPRLKSIPVAETKGRLIFADKDIQWSQGSRWSGKKLSIPLDNTMSQILWDAVEAGQTLISIEMEETLSGVRKNEEKKWDKTTVPFGATLPLTLDMKTYPSLFNKTDLGGRMVRGYTGIDIFCFDFIENLDENLYSKILEVAIPTPGKPLVESVTFRQDSSPRTRIEFKLAKDLDTAYKIRITRILNDGTSQAGPWEMREGEAMLDITDYKDPEK